MENRKDLYLNFPGILSNFVATKTNINLKTIKLCLKKLFHY